MKKSAGTTIPPELREAVWARDQGRCVVLFVGVLHDCLPSREIDHVRASGALGKKSRTTLDNLILTCPVGHRLKTNDGRAIRPLLLDYLARHDGECGHVDPSPRCVICAQRGDHLQLPATG